MFSRLTESRGELATRRSTRRSGRGFSLHQVGMGGLRGSQEEEDDEGGDVEEEEGSLTRLGWLQMLLSWARTVHTEARSPTFNSSCSKRLYCSLNYCTLLFSTSNFNLPAVRTRDYSLF